MPAPRKRLNFSVPAKPGVAHKFLTDNYYEVPSIVEHLKNGHLLYLYVANSRNVTQAEAALKKIVTSADVDSVNIRYSMQKIVKKSLDKFKKLTNPSEMQNFDSLCKEKFCFHLMTPKNKKSTYASPCKPHVSKSPLKTRRTCGNCKLLRASLKRSVEQKKELYVKRRVKNKYAPKRLGEKLKRRDNTIEQLKIKCAKSPASDLQKKEKKMTKTIKQNEIKISALDSELKETLKKHADHVTELETEYQNKVLELEEKVEDLENSKSDNSDFKKDGRKHTYKMRLMVYKCLMNNVPTENIPDLIHSFADQFGVDLDVKDVPVRSSVENMIVELGLISDLQAAELIYYATDVTIGFDATTQVTNF